MQTSIFDLEPGNPECIGIAACGKNGEYGRENKLPWQDEHNGDLEFFRQKTIGHPVIMGSDTHDSLPGMLEDRDEIVLTSTPGVFRDMVNRFDNLVDATRYAVEKSPHGRFFVIGGLSVVQQYYRADAFDRVIVTQFDETYGADRYLDLKMFDIDDYDHMTIESPPGCDDTFGGSVTRHVYERTDDLLWTERFKNLIDVQSKLEH